MAHIGFDRAASYYDDTRGFAEGVAERIHDAILAYTGSSPDTRASLNSALVPAALPCPLYAVVTTSQA